MRKVIKITGVEHKVSKAGRPYDITHLVVDDGEECELWGTDVRVGDEVMVFYDHDKIKAEKRFARFTKPGDKSIDKMSLKE